MDITGVTVSSSIAAGASNIIPVSAKTPDADSESPVNRIQPCKPLASTTNGVLKRHLPYNQTHHLNQVPASAPVTYKDCLKNHAASLGGYAVDGCGEFMPSPSATAADPTSLKCAACGCHRNFHRREPEEPPATALPMLEFQPHHRHHPPPPPPRGRSPDSQSPPPISSSYYPSAPHMLLALSAGLSGHQENPSPPINAAPTAAAHPNPTPHPNGRKRFRTKFSPGQKEKMYRFAERVGWKMQRKDEDLVSQFCSEIGVERGVLKVWMHNNKNTLGSRDFHTPNGVNRNGLQNVDHHGGGNGHRREHNDGGENNDNDDDDEDNQNHYYHQHHLNLDRGTAAFGTNGSSSSS